MAATSIAVGLVLIALGIIVTVASESSSATSLVPAFLGLAFVAIGLAARARPGLNRHVMHAGAALALIAVLGSLGSAVARGSTGWALFAQVATALVAGAFLLAAVASFRAARRARFADQSG